MKVESKRGYFESYSFLPIVFNSLKQNEITKSSLHSSSKTKVFFEDLLGYIRNLFLWPIHSTRLLLHSMIAILLFPIYLPILIIIAMVHAVAYTILYIITCGFCCGGELKFGPQFVLRTPSSDQKQFLTPVVQQEAPELPIEDGVNLLHSLDTFLDHIENYNTDGFGKKNSYVQGVMKIHVQGKAKVFTFHPNENRADIYHRYLRFIERNFFGATDIKQTFVLLDYSYFIGMLDLKLQTHLVSYEIGSQKGFSLLPSISSLWKSWRGKIYREETQEAKTYFHFAFWPGFTRRSLSHIINQSIDGNDISPYHISLLDLENLVH